MEPFRAEMAFEGKLRDLPAIIEFVESCCESAGVDPDRQFDIVLAVEEACSNVFQHAYKGKHGDVRVCLAAEGPDLHITLLDHGRPFDPSAVTEPDLSIPLEDRPVGGLGMHIMFKLMDQVEYTFQPGSNTLLMIKRDVIASPNGTGHQTDESGSCPGAGRPDA